jgi:hypothetical protein
MRLNFSYGIIGVVGVLVAISIGFISESPNEIPEPRIVELETPIACTMQWEPVCGVDGETYGNLCMLDAAEVTLAHEGECGIDDPIVKPRITPEVLVEPTPEPVEEELVMEVPAPGVPDVEEMIVIPDEEPIDEPVPEPVEEITEELPSSLTISIPDGTGVPGCEETNECFLPYEATVSVGSTVTWSNDDSAAHTVTSGTVTAGVTGIFDSSLFMSGGTFEFTFDEAGTYDYFCMVHPWMIGKVIVN